MTVAPRSETGENGNQCEPPRAHGLIQERLAMAIDAGDWNEAALALRLGADPQLENDRRMTPLEVAAADGRPRCLSELIAAMPKPGASLAFSRALRQAALFGNPSCAALALEAGADPDFFEPLDRQRHCANPAGDRPLTLACTAGYPCIVQALLAHGAHPDAGDAIGSTPLMWAASDQVAGRIGLRITVDRIERPSLDRDGEVEDWASQDKRQGRQRRHECARLLLAAGADIEAVDDSGLSAAMHAAYSGDVECFALLADAGAVLNRRSIHKEGCVDLARRSGFGEHGPAGIIAMMERRELKNEASPGEPLGGSSGARRI